MLKHSRIYDHQDVVGVGVDVIVIVVVVVVVLAVVVVPELVLSLSSPCGSRVNSAERCRR